jgi:aminomethyltransferase
MKKTIFHSMHVESGAKMVEFAGYEMPIQYPTGILAEHLNVRSNVGVFDVSHMGEFEVQGPEALDLIQRLTVNDAAKLQPGQAQYSAMCRPTGGIVDDLLVYCLAENNYMLVVNGANIEKDWAWVEENAAHFTGAAISNVSDDVHLLAVQGPRSLDVLQPLTDTNLEEIPYYHFHEGTLAGLPMILSRTGYTGEIGFELYFRGDEAAARSVVNALWDSGKGAGIAWTGLGARDSLRLEKGYCLYGNDIDETTNPLEAGLGWITKLKKGEFNGREAIQTVKDAGVTRKLMGFVMQTEKLIPRQGYDIVVDGTTVGKVTSGARSPQLNTGIGMGYIDVDALAPTEEGGEARTNIEIAARGTTFPAEIRKAPFV